MNQFPRINTLYDKYLIRFYACIDEEIDAPLGGPYVKKTHTRYRILDRDEAAHIFNQIRAEILFGPNINNIQGVSIAHRVNHYEINMRITEVLK